VPTRKSAVSWQPVSLDANTQVETNEDTPYDEATIYETIKLPSKEHRLSTRRRPVSWQPVSLDPTGSVPTNTQVETNEDTPYDEATISKTMKLPSVDEAPGIVKDCFHGGLLVSPSRLKDILLHGHGVKVSEEKRGADHNPTFRHRLSLPLGDTKQLDAIGDGTTKV
jgi:hypothetical protein